jgi:hypothetical protein
MELDEAKSLLSALANGINPVTGEVLPDTSPYNEPRVIRALFAVLDSVKGSKQPKRRLRKSNKKIFLLVGRGMLDCLGQTI